MMKYQRMKINLHAFVTSGFRCDVNNTFRSSEMLLSVASYLPTFWGQPNGPKMSVS